MLKCSFTDQNGRPLEIEGKVNSASLINVFLRIITFSI